MTDTMPSSGAGRLRVPASSSLRTLLRHPYLLLLAACLAVNVLFDGSAQGLLSREAPAAAGLLAGVAALLAAVTHPGRRSGLWAAGAAGVWLLSFAGLYLSDNRPRYLLTAGIALLLSAALLLGIKRRLSALHWALLLAAAGFLLRVAYILYTSVTTRQHDVWFFGDYKGHAGYIQYFYDHLALPDFNPLSQWQFYHPPLHHFLAALWMRGNTLLGMPITRVQESVQLLTLFYSASCMISGYKILREMRLKGAALLAPFALLCFHPTFFLMAGCINNDILSVAFSFGAILCTLRWIRRPGMGSILKIAVCVGCSMMAKLSGGLLAPAIAAVFLIRLWQQRRTPGRLIGQYAAFGCVCVPLGLWWGIRNLLRFGVPISYVPMLSEKEGQYIGHISVLQRLFDYSPRQLSSVFIAWGDQGAGYYEYNPVIGLLKSSVFGEYTLAPKGTAAYDWSVVLFYANMTLALTAAIALIWLLCKKKSPLSPTLKTFWGLLAGVMLFSYMQFCLIYPHTCTQNFRYQVPLLAVGTVALGLLLRHWEGKAGRIYGAARGALLAVCGVFCLASGVLYYLIA